MLFNAHETLDETSIIFFFKPVLLKFMKNYLNVVLMAGFAIIFMYICRQCL